MHRRPRWQPRENSLKIARDWNPTDSQSGYIGFVTRFEIDAEAATRYPVQRAGGSAHEELWVPSDELAEFNSHIIGPITIVEAYPGPKFAGAIDPKSLLPSEIRPTDIAGQMAVAVRGSPD